MDRGRLVVAVHVLVAIGFGGLGVVRIAGGNVAGGAVNVVFAAVIVAVGVYIGRQQA